MKGTTEKEEESNSENENFEQENNEVLATSTRNTQKTDVRTFTDT